MVKAGACPATPTGRPAFAMVQTPRSNSMYVFYENI